MKTNTQKMISLVFALLVTTVAFAQTTATAGKTKKTTNSASTMNTYLIERNIPGAGVLTGEELKGIAQKSCSVLKELGPEIEWVHSYVTADKIYCIYRAQNEEILRVHAEKGGFPINSVTKINTTISPATAELAAAK